MYEISVHAEFCAAHALVIAGMREQTHGHNFRVTARIEGPTLDSDGLLCDFHSVEGVMAEVIDPFRNANMNAVAPFDRENPSAEHIARYIAEELSRRLDPSLKPNAWVASVSVTEAPGCVATYRAPRA